MSKKVSAEIINTGYELLLGSVPNTNASWLCEKLTSAGCVVERITVVGDDMREIAECISGALKRRPRFLIVTGGLGPAPDDKTLLALAYALDKPLELNEKAYKWIKEKVAPESGELDPERLKMAHVPEGAIPLRNDVGTAPGVMLNMGETTIFVLPGVPDEMKAMFNSHVLPTVEGAAKESGSVFLEAKYELLDVCEAEVCEALAPLLKQYARNIRVKTHPLKGRILLHVYSFNLSRDSFQREVESLIRDLKSRVKRSFRVREAKGWRCTTSSFSELRAPESQR